MDKFIEKWRSDKKCRAKMKLLLYGIFIFCVSIYAISLNKNVQLNDNDNHHLLDNEVHNRNESIITIPKKYNYIINITIDDNNYKYYGTVFPNKTTITKELNNISINYVYENNEYYIEDNNLYIKTTKDEIYDIIKYNYINLETIDEYLSKATKSNNQYLVYLKDIILGNDSDEYLVILINDNTINIDYTPLMKQFNNDIKSYQVSIQIEEIEWKRWNKWKKKRVVMAYLF